MTRRSSIEFETESYVLRLGEGGRVVLSAKVRKRLELNPGDRLVLIVRQSGEMRLASLKRQIDKCMGMFADKSPERMILSEELIAERREDARR
jgi:bifunctional DNA-binding transcriptional regulator/antitoxin component of YhaV-PrlF toxin-antitoxin module